MTLAVYDLIAGTVLVLAGIADRWRTATLLSYVLIGMGLVLLILGGIAVPDPAAWGGPW